LRCLGSGSIGSSRVKGCLLGNSRVKGCLFGNSRGWPIQGSRGKGDWPISNARVKGGCAAISRRYALSLS
jgi:hypothetical protein